MNRFSDYVPPAVGALLLSFALAIVPRAADAQSRYSENSYLSFGLGAFDVLNSETTAGQFEIQYRPGVKLWIVQPMVGATVNTDGGLYGYFGLSADLFLSRNVVLRPSLAAGLYSEGDGKDLGGPVEFRSAIELAWQFENRMRLGLEFYHRSNASIYDINPGEESLMLTFATPMSGLFGR